MEEGAVHPYWNFSWRLFGRILAFLLIPWGARLVNRSLVPGGSVFALAWRLLSGRWGAGDPGIQHAFLNSLAELAIAAVITLLLALLIRQLLSVLQGSPWAGFAAWWVLFPILLAPIVSLVVFWKYAASTGLPPVLSSALLISLYPAGVSAMAASKSGGIWETLSLALHALANAAGGLIVTESALGVDGLGSRFLAGLEHSSRGSIFWIAFAAGAVVLLLHVLADAAAIGVDLTASKDGKGSDAPEDDPLTRWASVAIAAAALVTLALVKTRWADAATRTSGAFLILSPLLFVPAVGWGVLIGELRHKGGKARETLSGLLGWPLYVFFSVPGFYWVLMALAGSGHAYTVLSTANVLSAVAALYLFPRLVAVSSEAWGNRPHRTGSRMYGWQHGAVMLIALMAWTAGTGVFAISVPGFLGFGLPDVEPELGKMLSRALQGGGWQPFALALIFVPFLWTTIADSVIGLTKVNTRKQWIW
jgi:hypothetical protein